MTGGGRRIRTPLPGVLVSCRESLATATDTDPGAARRIPPPAVLVVSLEILVFCGALVAAGAAGIAYMWMRGRKSTSGGVPATSGSVVDPRAEQRAARALALDAISEAVVIVQENGQVRDCNSAALALFQRHRNSIHDVFVSTLRTLDDATSDPYGIARERGLWSGPSWTRRPDGSVSLCITRIVPLRDTNNRIAAFSESYRDAVGDHLASEEMRDRLFGVHAAASANGDSTEAEIALSLLGASFRDIENAVQHYERVVAALWIQDAVTESMAGLIHDVRKANSSAATRKLLADIPQLLAVVRSHFASDKAMTTSKE